MPKTYRQGDLLLVETDKKLSGNENTGPNALTLAFGEVTGHRHQVNRGRTYGSLGQGLILEVPQEGAILSHEEHGSIMLPVGVYEVLPQRTFSEAGEHRVLD